MSSSDSDGDIFGNIAHTLEAKKQNYSEDKVENAIFLNDSTELDEILKTTEGVNKNKKKVKVKSKKNTSAVSAINEVVELDDVDLPSVSGTNHTTRTTRSSASKRKSEGSIDENEFVLPPSRRKKGSTSNKSQNSSPQGRGRGRSRGRGKSRGRGAKRRSNNSGNPMGFSDGMMNVLQSMFPTYSVGNTDEYPDHCDNQQLFSNKKTDIIEIQEDLNESIEDNEEVSVKVIWQNTEYFKFMIRKYQKLAQIFDFFSDKASVSKDKLLLMYNDKIIKPEDTPHSIEYNFVKFIDAGITTETFTNLSKAQVIDNDIEIKDGIKLKFQCQNHKKPYEIVVKRDDKMSVAMLRCAEHFEIALNKLKFEFDGDVITGKSTPEDLELEGGECIDVKIKE